MDTEKDRTISYVGSIKEITQAQLELAFKRYSNFRIYKNTTPFTEDMIVSHFEQVKDLIDKVIESIEK